MWPRGILEFYMRGFCQQMAAKAPENPSPVHEGNFVRACPPDMAAP